MRLIDADKLNLLLGNSDRDIYAKYMLDKMPTIDAVPVVRCRECKYRRLNHLTNRDILSCENIDVCGEEYLFERNPNDFCSYGERK